MRPMPKATVESVDHVARLARLSLREDERHVFARQLDQILAYAESIQKLDTSGIPPMSHASAREAFRDDVVAPGLSQDRATAGAPDAESGLFRVPRIL